ncbi:MAG: phosphate acyltransferase PlsX [Halanaerobiales bacterium]|nr:phosphate acyltransferase PlsX [Halanaerobiales bacterium]
MRIVIDAMGGDQAPEEIVKGTVNAVNEFSDLTCILTGKEGKINRILDNYEYKVNSIEIVDASQVVTMSDKPSEVIRKKKDSSLIVGSNLVKDNKAEALISAGNTGAVMASGIFNIGRVSVVKRPPIATVFPSKIGKTIVLDAGANVDSSPQHLIQFAIMGQIYAEQVLNITNPRVGLLSIGEEKEKGNKLNKNTYELMEEENEIKNFIGNVEGRDIFKGNCDVIVCDGFVGNIVLKTTEGVASFVFDLLKDTLTKNLKSKLGALLLKDELKKMKEKVDYKQYGGAPLLGLKGLVIISHGSSDAQAIFSAIKVAREAIQNDVVKIIENKLEK